MNKLDAHFIDEPPKLIHIFVAQDPLGNLIDLHKTSDVLNFTHFPSNFNECEIMEVTWTDRLNIMKSPNLTWSSFLHFIYDYDPNKDVILNFNSIPTHSGNDKFYLPIERDFTKYFEHEAFPYRIQSIWRNFYNYQHPEKEIQKMEEDRYFSIVDFPQLFEDLFIILKQFRVNLLKEEFNEFLSNLEKIENLIPYFAKIDLNFQGITNLYQSAISKAELYIIISCPNYFGEIEVLINFIQNNVKENIPIILYLNMSKYKEMKNNGIEDYKNIYFYPNNNFYRTDLLIVDSQSLYYPLGNIRKLPSKDEKEIPVLVINDSELIFELIGKIMSTGIGNETIPSNIQKITVNSRYSSPIRDNFRALKKEIYSISKILEKFTDIKLDNNIRNNLKDKIEIISDILSELNEVDLFDLLNRDIFESDLLKQMFYLTNSNEYQGFFSEISLEGIAKNRFKHYFNNLKFKIKFKITDKNLKNIYKITPNVDLNQEIKQIHQVFPQINLIKTNEYLGNVHVFSSKNLILLSQFGIFENPDTIKIKPSFQDLGIKLISSQICSNMEKKINK